MTVISSLGAIAGAFLFVPKGLWVFVALWGVAKVQPLATVTLLGVWLLVERWL